MPTKIRPWKRGKDVLSYLRALYLQSEQDIIDEIARKRTLGYVDYGEVAALERIQATLHTLVDETWRYAPVMVEKIFYDTYKDIRGYRNARALTMPQTAIAEHLANNLIGEVMEAAGTAERSARGFLVGRTERDPFQAATLRAVARQEAAGGMRHRTAGQIQAELNSRGITAFVDKRGREWSLSDYASMAARTTAKQAQVAAILTEDESHDLYTIPRIGTTCPVCAALEGRVYSRSGMDPDYPPLTLAFGKIAPGGPDDLTNTYLNIHPNCLHPLVKYTTMGKTDKQVQRDKDFSSPEKNPVDVDPRSKRQIREYREKAAARQKMLSDRKQHMEYREALGDMVPSSFENFRKMKYNGGVKWDEAQASYRKADAYNKITKSEPAITADLVAVSKETGIQMAGLEHRLKAEGSFLRKVDAGCGGSLDLRRIKEAINATNDVIRYTYVDSPLSLASSYKNVTAALEGKGYGIVRVKNFWKDRGNPYNGVNCTFKAPDGRKFEIQFHTPESYGVKDRMHKDYEAWRQLDPASPEAMALRRKMMGQSRGMEIPANIEEVR